MSRLYIAFAVLVMLGGIIAYHRIAVHKAYVNGRAYERSLVKEAVIETKAREAVIVDQLEEKNKQVEIVYREKKIYVEKSQDKFMDCVMSDDLFLQLDSIRTATDL